MVKKIFVCLLLALALGCDDNGPKFPQACRLPTSFPEFQECPEEAFMRGRACEGYIVEIEGFDPEEVLLTFDLVDCEFPDCFTMDCEFTETDRDTGEVIAIHNGVFSDVENFPGPGLVSVDGGDPVEYSFIIVMP